jgi:hypothetical protein
MPITAAAATATATIMKGYPTSMKTIPEVKRKEIRPIITKAPVIPMIMTIIMTMTTIMITTMRRKCRLPMTIPMIRIW